MKLKQFEHSWHGVDFRDLPASSRESLPALDFYAALYAAAKDHKPDAAWMAEKTSLCDWVEQKILKRYKAPRILSIAAGLAIVEQKWLASGYNVALNECQAESLAAVRDRFPGVETLIGSASELEIPGKYDIIAVFTVDYALDDASLAAMLTRLRGALAPGGIIVNLTVNVLTVRRLLAEGIKHWLLRRYNAPGWVLWGWTRSPGEIIAHAARSGLRLKEQYIKSGSDFRRRPGVFWRLPPLRHPEMLMLFEKTD